MTLLAHSMRVLVFMFLIAEKNFYKLWWDQDMSLLKPASIESTNCGNLLVNRGIALYLINANHPVYSIEIKSD